ncbi:MAG: hypothetical protein NWQ54_17615 [Paraglaciecola sp.]|nr:hypothetical protein [Paraglaciecola sp.]
MMKVFYIGAALLSLSFAGQASEKVEQSMDVDARSYVKIEHVNGEATIQSWDKDEVKVIGTLGDRTDKFIFERKGNDVLIKVKVKNSSGWGKWSSDEGDDLKIWLPVGSTLDYSSVNADVKVTDIAGGSSIETVNGRIDVKNLSSRVKLESVNGNIDARKLKGNVSIETVNGNIKSGSDSGSEDKYGTVNGNIDVTSDSEDIRVETVNGNVDLSLGKIRQLNIESVNGAIESAMTLMDNGEVNVSTVGGSVELAFQPKVSARFDIQAHAGGGISNNLSSDKVQKDKYGPSRWLEFSLNQGKASVNISTVSGRVELNKK